MKRANRDAVLSTEARSAQWRDPCISPPAPRSKQGTALASRLSHLVSLASLLLLTACAPPRSSHIVIGAKNFTEQVILGELLAQEIEASGGGPVERRFWLAGSYICQQALLSNRIDAYVEYTGTALTAILKQPVMRDPTLVNATITALYGQLYHVRVFPSLGFEDTFAMVIRGADARTFNLHNLSDITPLAPIWRLGVGYEFAERPDGLRGLDSAYHLHFADAPRTMELGLLYRSLSNHQVDIVAGNSTDGVIRALHFTALDDNLHYFPPYQAVPLVREDSLRRWPQITTALNRLAGKITADDMRAMNLEVDAQHRDPADVVRDFRSHHNL
ncbi:MAG TPA: glycine betaine ABC transporter substrate-binding protein [Acidobacteriaceae bacterium]|nr:glycine betaine ABC transporter substrate-binding protein [Acidobacteriaceae bacterium]